MQCTKVLDSWHCNGVYKFCWPEVLVFGLGEIYFINAILIWS